MYFSNQVTLEKPRNLLFVALLEITNTAALKRQALRMRGPRRRFRQSAA